MAVTVTGINKYDGDRYMVTVQDSGCVIGLDEKGADMYWTCSLSYNPANSAESLKERVEGVIKARKTIGTDEATVLSQLQATIESIDVSKL